MVTRPLNSVAENQPPLAGAGAYCGGRTTGRKTVFLSITDEVYVFQQNSAPTHSARQTVQLLRRKTVEFSVPDMWPPNSPDLNPVDYRNVQ